MAQKSAQPITSIEHIPASEHGKGFPPFNPDTFASQLLWFVLVFVTLYLLMSRLALPRVGEIMAARQARVEGDLAAAIAAYEKSLADARGRAQALANETREKYAAEAEARRKDLDITLNARVADAENVIGTQRAAAMGEIRNIAVDAAAAIVERLIGQSPDKAGVAGAVADALKR
jgi:F-type H+-transporting ATPase subunit b